MSETVTVIARARAKAGQEARVRDLLLSLVAPTRAEAGCINYDLHESPERPGEFLFHENWRSKEDLAAHFTRPHMVAAFKLIPELVDGVPDITQWQRLG